MTKKIVKIPAVNGHYSILSLREKLAELEGVKDVRVDITTRQARIIWDTPATWEAIKNKLVEIGYPPQE